jgi:DNA-binding NtrC family response regulator
MPDQRPYALVIDREDASRAQLTAFLRESGFAVAGFRESRGALAALAAEPVNLAVIAGYWPQGSDALAAARQIRHYQPQSRVLFTGAGDTLPGDPGANAACTVTRPLDQRRFLSAVLALMADGDDSAARRTAEFGLVEAQLACLYNRRTIAATSGAASDVAWQTRDALAARDALRRTSDEVVEAG